MKTASIRMLILFGLLASSTACARSQLPEITVTNTIAPSETSEPTSTSTPSATPIPTTTPAPAPVIVGALQPIPPRIVYLGNKDELALGFNMSAGGSIGSLLYYGQELVDRKDYGRYIQLSLYDGNQKYGPSAGDAFGNWPWNPIQAGSRAYRGAKVLEYRRTEAGVYIKAYGKEWGQKDTDSDMIFETWAWLRNTYFEVHVRATHIGSDTHGATSQEFPAAYFSTRLTKQFSYFGHAPFTAQPIDGPGQLGNSSSCPAGVTPTENWVAYANNRGRGLILALPPQPYLTSSWAFCVFTGVSPAVGYAAPIAFFDNPPNAVHDATFYLIPGLIEKGRAIVYDLIPHTTWTFNLDSTEGWHSRAATTTVKSGVLTAQLSPNDFLAYAGLHVSERIVPSVDIRARARGADANLCLSFLTTNEPYWDLNRNNVSCILVSAGEFQTYTFEFKGKVMSDADAITQYRLSTLEPSTIDIDSLAVAANGLAP